MAPPIPSCEPVSFIGGDTVRWYRKIADYPPSDGWTLKYRFVGDPQLNSGTAYTAAPDSTGQPLATIPAVDTAAVQSDTIYRLLGWVENGSGERHAVHESIVTVFGNVATATIEDLQTKAEATLALIDAAIDSRLTSDGIESYAIDGRSTQLMTLAELQQLRSAYAVRVARERGLTHPRHGVRFHAAR